MITSIDKKPVKCIEVDLTGPEGNVFYLIALAEKLGKRLKLQSDKIVEEMMSSNYENAVQVFDKNFGDYVVLYR